MTILISANGVFLSFSPVLFLVCRAYGDDSMLTLKIKK